MKTVISLICIIMPTMYFGIIGRTVEMGIALPMGVIAAFFINIDRFNSFKAAGIEAQLKEAKKVIDEATVTIDELKAVVEPLIISTLHNITYMGRWGSGGKTGDKDGMRDGCRMILTKLGIMSEAAESAINNYNFYTLWDAYADIQHEIIASNCFAKEVSDKIISELSVPKMYEDIDFPSIEFAEQVFINNGISIDENPKIKALFDEYSHRLAYNVLHISE